MRSVPYRSYILMPSMCLWIYCVMISSSNFLAWFIDLKYPAVFSFSNITTLFTLSLPVFKNRNNANIQKPPTQIWQKYYSSLTTQHFLKSILLLVGLWAIFTILLSQVAVQRKLHASIFRYFARVSLGYKPRSGTAETEMYAYLQSFYISSNFSQRAYQLITTSTGSLREFIAPCSCQHLILSSYG